MKQLQARVLGHTVFVEEHANELFSGASFGALLAAACRRRSINRCESSYHRTPNKQGNKPDHSEAAFGMLVAAAPLLVPAPLLVAAAAFGRLLVPALLAGRPSPCSDGAKGCM